MTYSWSQVSRNIKLVFFPCGLVILLYLPELISPGRQIFTQKYSWATQLVKWLYYLFCECWVVWESLPGPSVGMLHGSSFPDTRGWEDDDGGPVSTSAGKREVVIAASSDLIVDFVNAILNPFPHYSTSFLRPPLIPRLPTACLIYS